jgi:four helix bundle protein
MGNFEDLVAWQKARQTQKEIFTTFYHTNQYWFKEQIFKAMLSVSNNIAEGFERKSDKEFLLFLNYSKASCGEVRSMLYTAEDMGFCSGDTADMLRTQTLEVSRIIQGLINFQKSKIT